MSNRLEDYAMQHHDVAIHAVDWLSGFAGVAIVLGVIMILLVAGGAL